MYIPRSLSLIRRALINAPNNCNNGRMFCQSSNDEILTDFVNRNPRSMELLRLARKPKGYCLDTPTIRYYYRLNFEVSQKHVTGFVEHNKGYVVVSASTKEWCIRRHLYSSIDASAAQNIGRILARRCLQAGIPEMHTELEKIEDKSRKVHVFLDAIRDGGITLGEVSQIREHDMHIFRPSSPVCPWEVTEEYVERMDKLYPPDTLYDELSPPR